MSRIARLIALALVLATPSLAAASTWKIDPAHSAAHFAVKHLVVSTVRGDMGPVSGTVVLDEADPTKSTVTASVDATAINTRDAKRDEHLRSPDFLDTAKHPTVTFTSSKIEKVADGQYKVTGDLTLRGVTKPVVLTVEGSPTPVRDPFGNTKLGGSATTRIDRQDFGIAWSKSLDAGGLVVGDTVDITIDLELTKQ
jgi:polyisoprenoid-binding protein YceI